MDEEEGFLPAEDVSSDLFSEDGGVAIDVQIVVLKLEGESDFLSEAIERVGVFIRCVSCERTEFGGAAEEHGGFEPNHLDVFFLRHIDAVFKVHVVLLSLADFCGGACEEREHAFFVRAVGVDEVSEGSDEHGVAGEHCRVFVPFHVNGGFAASHVGVVHQVIVEERVVVIGFNREGCGHGDFRVVAIDGASQKHEGGAEAFSAHGEGVGNWLIEPLWLGGIGHGVQGSVDGI